MAGQGSAALGTAWQGKAMLRKKPLLNQDPARVRADLLEAYRQAISDPAVSDEEFVALGKLAAAQLPPLPPELEEFWRALARDDWRQEKGELDGL